MKLLCIAECAHDATRAAHDSRRAGAGTRVPSTAQGMSRVEAVVVTDAEMFADESISAAEMLAQPAGPSDVQWPARAFEEDVTAIVEPYAPRYTKQAVVCYRTTAEQGSRGGAIQAWPHVLLRRGDGSAGRPSRYVR